MANEQQIANLIVKLSAQTVELAAGLKKGEGMVSSFKDVVQKVLGGITLTALGYKFAKSITDAKNYAVEISKTAEKIGISTVDLSKLADAADDVGLSLDALARGIRFLERSMLEASKSEGEQRSVFKALKVEYESSPGVVRPAIDVILDLADAFKQMGEEDPTKAPKAMALMGRGAVEMIPLLNKGKQILTEWMATSEKTGMVISEGLGKRAREFSRTMQNVGDAVKGVSITIMSELLPSLQSGARYLLEMAEATNRMRGSVGYVIEGVKILLAAIIPLTVAVLVHANAIGIANLAMKAYGATLALFSGWIGWVVLGLVAASAAWNMLGKAERDAQRDQQNFADSLRTMKMDDLQTELRETERLLSLMRQRYAALMEELESTPPDALSPFAGAALAKEADEMAKAITRYMERVKLLRKTLAEIPKGPSEGIPDAGVMKALRDRVTQLQAAMSEFVDPVAKARAELKAFIQQTVDGKGDIKLYQKAIDEVTAANERYIAAALDLKIQQARIAGNLQNEIAVWDKYLSDLEIDYGQGLVGVEHYYNERARIVEEKTAKEIAALKEKRALPGVGQEVKIAIDLEIKAKETGLAAALNKEKADAKKAIDEFKATVRLAELQAIVDQNALDLEILTGQYDAGLLDLATFYQKRREMAQAEAEKEIANIEAAKPMMSDKEKVAAETEIAKIRARAGVDQIRINREMAADGVKSVMAQIDAAKMLASIKAEGAMSEFDAMKFRNDAELAELDRKNLEEINQLSAFLGQKSDLEMSFGEKRQAMEELYAAQDERRRNRLMLQEFALAQKRMDMNMMVVSGMEDIFGKLYDMGGGKMKAFFLLQKAMAIAQIYLQASIAAMSALAPPPIGLGPLAGAGLATMVWAMAAANIAIVLAQTIKGMRKGGPVTEGSGRKDDVPAMLTKGEYVQPEPTVRYYTAEVMEVIRRRLIPKEVLQRAAQGFGFFPVARPQFAFAGGGEVFGGDVTDSRRTTFNFPMTFNAPVSDRAVEKIHDGVERLVIQILKEETR